MDAEIEKRREKVLTFIKEKKEYLVYIILALIALFGYYIRTLNLGLLRGKYLLDPDAHLVLRYVRYISEHGSLFSLDSLRSYPLGFSGTEEFSFLSNFIVYLYKFLHFFNPKLTLTEVHIFYPAVAFVIALPFFYLFVKRLFGIKVALISSFFLTVIPAYLFRTMSGVSDKEALAMIFFYAAFYFFIVGWQTRRIRYALLFGVLSGIATAALGAIWGGVAFVIITISSLILIENLFGKLTRKDMYLFFSWGIFSYLFLLYLLPKRYSPVSYFSYNYAGWFLLLAFLMVLIQFLLFELNLFKIKERIYSLYDLPHGAYSIIFTLILVFIGAVVLKGFNYILTYSKILLEFLLKRDVDRWGLTVAESHQPYLVDWMGSFGPHLYGIPILFWSFLIGSIFFFYEFVKVLHKYKWRLTIAYSVFLFALLFSRYKSESTFNGDTFISQVTYVGSFMLLFTLLLFLYFYLYYRDKESLTEFAKLDKKYIFMFVFFILVALGARTAIRLLFVLSPIVIIFTAYLIEELYKLVKSYVKYSYIKYACYVAIILIYSWSAYSFSLDSINQASQSGTSLQWPIAMEWVKQNTPKNAVFASWWDYGYYIQTLSERATVTDGGNVIGYWNHLMGRHFLTAQNETEALEWLKSHNVSYVIIDPSDIGKYPAFSSIGSDENYDRYSFINTFKLDMNSVQETKNKTIFLYRGSFPFDGDYIYKGVTYPAFASGVAGIFLPGNLVRDGDKEGFIPEQPEAILVEGGRQHNIPLRCLYLNEKLIEYDDGFDGCLRIMPTIEGGNNINPIGSALFLSPRVKGTLFADLYLFDGKKYPNFELVYSDEKQLPLGLFYGRQLGPLRIWKVSYPESIQFKEEYAQTWYPNLNVTKPKFYS